MKERPILFSGEMVRAILAGRKTVTRRVVKQQIVIEGKWDGGAAIRSKQGTFSVGFINERNGVPLPGDPPYPCPYGQPGDRLWVRETWGILDGNYGPAKMPLFEYTSYDEADPHTPFLRQGCQFVFQADHRDPAGDGPAHPFPWRPSIHMPRWASRITLEVTGVRVERVQDITEESARAEGVSADCLEKWESKDDTAIGMFGGLWDSLNAKRGFGWDKNPWVWVVEFRRIGA